jgi:hypothetical protein
MFLRRKKENKNRTQGKAVLKNKVANQLAVYLSRIQNGFAGLMGRWVNRLTQRGKKIFLIIFILVFGSYSLYILLNTFIGNRKKSVKSVKPADISIPKYLNKAGDENTSKTVVVTDDDLKKIRSFNQYMDSLKLSITGKRVYDSIRLTRPGLMDSIRVLEQIYFFQQKNK